MEALVKKWLSSCEVDAVTRVQNLDKAVCISLSANTLGKGMNPAILTPAISKLEGTLSFLPFVWQPV